jgi:hypothetical protein
VKNYCLKILAIAAVLIAIHVVIVLTVRSPIPGSYPVRQLIAQKRGMLAALPSPRIIFFGGSNVLMGIDAEAVGRACRIPAFNFGLQAGMRVEDILAEASRSARAGDVVVLALEPEYYVEEKGWSDWQLRSALAWNRPAFDGQPLGTRLRIIYEASTPLLSSDLVWSAILQRVNPAAVKDRVAIAQESDEEINKALAERAASNKFGYTAKNMDDFGDILNTQGDNVHFWGAGTPLALPGTMSAFSKTILLNFVNEMKARKVRVFFSHTPYIVDGPAPDDWKGSEQLLEADIHTLGSEFLEGRDQLFYPRVYFFDTRLHLNQQGRSVRTKMLFEALRKKLQLPYRKRRPYLLPPIEASWPVAGFCFSGDLLLAPFVLPLLMPGPLESVAPVLPGVFSLGWVAWAKATGEKAKAARTVVERINFFIVSDLQASCQRD